MPIARYGVLRGRPEQKIDGTDRSPHYQVRVTGAEQQYRIAINVRSVQQPDEVLYYRDQDFRHDMLGELVNLEEGFTLVRSEHGGLALDFVRDELFDTARMRPLPMGIAAAQNDLNQVFDGLMR